MLMMQFAELADMESKDMKIDDDQRRFLLTLERDAGLV